MASLTDKREGGVTLDLELPISHTDQVAPWVQCAEDRIFSDMVDRTSEVLYFRVERTACDDGVADGLMAAIRELLVKHQGGFTHWSFGRCGLTEEELFRNRDSLKGTAFFQEGLRIPVWIGTVEGHRVSICREINDGAFRMWVDTGGTSDATGQVKTQLERVLGCGLTVHPEGNHADQARLRAARKRARQAPRLRKGRLP